MKIVSWNVNGIRACLKKGFLEWLERASPDILCLQETKAVEDQLAAEDRDRIAALGYTTYWHSAVRKGYSGVATFCKREPLFVTRGVPFERDEGRVIVTEHGDFALYNCCSDPGMALGSALAALGIGGVGVVGALGLVPTVAQLLGRWRRKS